MDLRIKPNCRADFDPAEFSVVCGNDNDTASSMPKPCSLPRTGILWCSPSRDALLMAIGSFVRWTATSTLFLLSAYGQGKCRCPDMVGEF